MIQCFEDRSRKRLSTEHADRSTSRNMPTDIASGMTPLAEAGRKRQLDTAK
ncbi:MAG: hypothetical protein HN867_15030 [Deltaproteobacteria bacterium]|nr:hypothetical protein [Deltaproteobacteria bacterium]MBT7204774.1 hypothetical protein [Deltaproteobacteria bacterium]MDG2196571.1 hypothetical protein [SAR324 cluster bacterium]